ncbi:RluA family pseudouridine synthase [Buchnera aphidicola]|uniref:RluA family pseudouridine synthase n=1 Tax=Buchnera aphidicola TaxID=9 RepID=UPI0034649295
MNIKNNVSTLHISHETKDQRIDNFICSKFQKTKKNLLYKLIRKGFIKINQKKILPYYKLKSGDILSYPDILKLKNTSNISHMLNKKLKKKLLSCILYEDDYLLIINKPSGIAVHGGSGLKFGIIEIFRYLKPECHFLELIHRIDRDTSGVLMLAKKKMALRSLHEQFRNNEIQKQYFALLHGHLKNKNLVIKTPLKKKIIKNKKKIISVNNDGKKSISIFKVKKKLKSSTIVYITPKTGRTHQIRVHASYIGHPIIFDPIYGNYILDNNIDKKYKKKKLLLHALSIKFQHPKNFQKCLIHAPISNRFKKHVNDFKI